MTLNLAIWGSLLFFISALGAQNYALDTEIQKLNEAVYTASASVQLMHGTLLACEKGTLQEFREKNREELLKILGGN